MTPVLLTSCGKALYGDRWQSALAADLGVADRTIRRWVSGESPVPEGAQFDIQKLMRERVSSITALLRDVRRLAAPHRA